MNFEGSGQSQLGAEAYPLDFRKRLRYYFLAVGCTG